MSEDYQDYSKDFTVGVRKNGYYRNNQSLFQTPLLPTPPKFYRNESSNTNQNQKFNNNNGIRSRLGRKHFNNLDKSSNHSHENNFNRKRPSPTNGPSPIKRRWRNRQPFYQQSNSQANFAQKRLNVIRNHQSLGSEPRTQLVETANESQSVNASDSQEFEPTDITVEVINNNLQCQEESSYPTRFKMLLDSKTQAAIKVIQQKRKEKQVIFPFPITPNVTGVSLHDRFTML